MSLNTLSKTEFFVTNRFRRYNEHPLEFTCDLPYASENGPNTYFLRIDTVTLENFFPTIQTDVNDKFYFKYNGVTDFFIFQEGNYDIYSLIDSFQTALQSKNAGFILNFDAYQFTLSLFIPAGVSFSVIRPNPLASFPTDWSYPDVTDRFLEIIGWTIPVGNENILNGGAGGYTYVPKNPVRCRSSSFYDLCTDAPVTQSYNNGNNGTLKILTRIEMTNTSFGSTVNQRTLIDRPYAIDLTNVNSLKFFLTDEWQQRVTVPEGRNVLLAIGFSITLANL